MDAFSIGSVAVTLSTLIARHLLQLNGLSTASPWVVTLRALAEFDGTVAAEGIQAPTLAVAGRYGTCTSATLLRELAAAYPNGEYAESRDAAHLIPLENPVALGRILRQFINDRGIR